MKPNLIHKRAKYFRRLHREERELWHKKRNTPKVELDQPFQRGWGRFFILTDEAKLRKDADDLDFVLQHFQNHEFCRKGWFRTISPEGRRWTKNEIGVHHLRRPYLSDLVKGSFPRRLYPHVKHRFIDMREGMPPARKLKLYQRECRVTFRHLHLIKSHTQPHIITHLPLHDPALEARLHEIETILWETGPRGQINKALHHRRYRWDDYERSKSEQSNREAFNDQLREANFDPTIKSAISPRFFCVCIVNPLSRKNSSGRKTISFLYSSMPPSP